MKYDTVIFDLDGTVLYTIEDIANALNYSLRHFAFPEITLQEATDYVGNGARRLVTLAAPKGTDGTVLEELLSFYNKWYDEHSVILTRPYDGMVELMERLQGRGVKLAIVSNKPDMTVKGLAQRFFPGLLETAVGDRPGAARKPAPDAVLAACSLMGSELCRTVYVGDSEVDVLTAKNAGIDCISVSYGYRSRETLVEAGAKSIAGSVAELEELLDKS